MMPALSETACNRVSFVVLLILAAGIVGGIVVNAGTGWDFANFYDAGHKVRAGEAQHLYEPFAPIGGKAPEGHLPYYGAPLSAVLLAPLASLPPAEALVAFKIQNSVALVIALWLLYRW